MMARRWWALVMLVMPVLAVMVAVSALSFAVPALSADLRPSGEELLWVLDVYPLALAGLLIPAGLLADRFGRRRVLVIGTVLFSLTSLAAAFAPTATHLIAARAVMGVFGACLMPSTMSLITTVFADEHERRLAIAIWTSGFAGAGAIGPIVGGWILAHWWWGAIFLVPLVCNIVFLAGVYVLVPESRAEHGEPIDPLSTVLLILALAPPAFGTKRLATSGVSAVAVLALLVGVVCAVWFVRRQLRMPAPMLDVRLFTDPVITMAVLANFAVIAVFAGVQLFLTQHLQLVNGLPAGEAGWWMLPGALASMVMGVGVVYLARSVPRWLLIGIGLGGAGLAAAASVFLRVDTPLIVPVLMYTALGLTEAMSTTLSTDALMGAAPDDRAGAASGISETAFELGTALGIAILGSVTTAVYARSLGANTIPGLSGDQVEAAGQTLGAAVDIAHGIGGPVGESLRVAAESAFLRAENVTGLIGGLLLVVVAVVVARSHRRSGLTRA